MNIKQTLIATTLLHGLLEVQKKRPSWAAKTQDGQGVILAFQRLQSSCTTAIANFASRLSRIVTECLLTRVDKAAEGALSPVAAHEAVFMTHIDYCEDPEISPVKQRP